MPAHKGGATNVKHFLKDGTPLYIACKEKGIPLRQVTNIINRKRISPDKAIASFKEAQKIFMVGDTHLKDMFGGKVPPYIRNRVYLGMTAEMAIEYPKRHYEHKIYKGKHLSFWLREYGLTRGKLFREAKKKKKSWEEVLEKKIEKIEKRKNQKK